MGYTDSATKILIGLGVSSISDCNTAFAQNSKTVEHYLEHIESKSLAVEKGHLLNDKDLYLKQHILNLMCKGATYFNDEIPLAIKNRLTPLVNDNLVEVEMHHVRIAKLGKSFLRNICMAFDERLWNSKPDTSLFSKAV